MAETAGCIFGTGAAPWLDMMRAWEEANAPEGAPGPARENNAP